MSMTDEEYKEYLKRRQARIDEKEAKIAERRSNRLINEFVSKNPARALIHEMQGQKGIRKRKLKRRKKGKNYVASDSIA